MSEPTSPEAAPKPRVIKRYSNRKLYDTVESRYITLEEISEMVKQGQELQIVDNKSKEDLTSVTLAQIIFEEEKKANRMPLVVLKEIIRAPGETLTGFISRELTPRVASIREGAEESASELLASTQRAFEDWQHKMDDRIKGTVGNLSGNLPATGKDLHALIQRLEQLERQVRQLEEEKKK